MGNEAIAFQHRGKAGPVLEAPCIDATVALKVSDGATRKHGREGLDWSDGFAAPLAVTNRSIP